MGKIIFHPWALSTSPRFLPSNPSWKDGRKCFPWVFPDPGACSGHLLPPPLFIQMCVAKNCEKNTKKYDQIDKRSHWFPGKIEPRIQLLHCQQTMRSGGSCRYSPREEGEDKNRITPGPMGFLEMFYYLRFLLFYTCAQTGMKLWKIWREAEGQVSVSLFILPTTCSNIFFPG